ncbi:hypothetical protein V501_00618 [Pseudogymnoascus sp. VKM F-4519 (FW-2642)]|nr:hypothetical protein V501_00618 [Pseudogymnoascus sp. VKM F-4519 (FW-2642)]
MPKYSADYDAEAIAKAKTFLCENPIETIALSSRLYRVNENTLKSSIRNDRKDEPRKPNGGQNKILTEYQELAVYKYVQDMYNAGFGATKEMTFAAICAMKEAEDREAPS